MTEPVPARRHARQQGFTLLEVIVALTITGFVLGGLFSLVAGSKRLAWRSEDSLARTVNQRAQINFALLENELNEVEPVLVNDNFQLRPGDFLEVPERKTQAIAFDLQTIEISDSAREEVIMGTRWIQLELPR